MKKKSRQIVLGRSASSQKLSYAPEPFDTLKPVYSTQQSQFHTIDTTETESREVEIQTEPPPLTAYDTEEFFKTQPQPTTHVNLQSQYSEAPAPVEEFRATTQSIRFRKPRMSKVLRAADSTEHPFDAYFPYSTLRTENPVLRSPPRLYTARSLSNLHRKMSSSRYSQEYTQTLDNVSPLKILQVLGQSPDATQFRSEANGASRCSRRKLTGPVQLPKKAIPPVMCKSNQKSISLVNRLRRKKSQIKTIFRAQITRKREKSLV